MTLPPKLVVLEGEEISITVGVKLGRAPGGYLDSGDFGQKRVRVSKGHTAYSLRQIVWQELGHAAWAKSALPDHYGAKTEEAVVHELLFWMLVLMRQNPELVNFLMEPEPASGW